MKVFQFWVKEEQHTENDEGFNYDLRCWGGSNESVEDASQVAQSKLANLIKKVQSREFPDDYGYGAEIRETLIEEIHDTHGNLIAAVTRNRYGALVLNVQQLFIADIDTEPLGCAGIFTSAKKMRQKQMDRITDFAQTHRELGIRLYETNAGFRLFITNQAIPTSDPKAKEFLTKLNSDYLYQILCFKQECYRARLTPKPWRLELNGPACTLLDMNDEEWEVFNAWLKEYETKSQGRSVCRLINTWGSESMSDDIAKIIELHDRHTLGTDQATLA